MNAPNMSQDWPNEAILLMLSGGIDSTYALFKYLTETDFPIHVHHISMRVAEEPRYTLEDRMCTNIIGFCGGYRNLTYTESVFEFNLPYTGWDTDVQLLIGARVAANLEAKRVNLVLGTNADAVEREEVIERNKHNVLYNLWEANIASIDAERRDRINPVIHLPFERVTKTQMIREMPTGLRKMTWSCRKPKEVGDEYVPCGKCHACVARDKALWECRKS